MTPPAVRQISRLLIANRGEIACRVARTAHRLGIDTVGVYSEPDRNALHVDVVDIAVALGGATPAESYLRGAAIIEAALANGADAVHPGYGFLSERADFARAVVDAGLIWIGPTPANIELLGDKIAAKRTAIEAGVPTTEIVEVADGLVPDGLAMPVLVKAAAGGGGRGMRIVRTPADLPDAIAAASREAASAFGDGTVFIEPYIERGRHVEVQIFGDAYGNVVHLHERECSIQRRNQKVLEEAPSPGIDDATRATLHAGAVALARHVGYQNAGTVEFLVGDGPDPTITFLEVNTRLQVEHPVTEAVTGLDLVELQLVVASGAPLPLTQDAVRVHGHAIEVRVVAEDPAAGWMPSTGTVTAFAVDRTRVDTGIRAGSVVTTDYDSLVAKVVAFGPDRGSTARRLARTLRTGRIDGIRTNRDALVAILVEPDFLAGRTTTAYLDDHPDVLTSAGPTGDDLLALLLSAVFADERAERRADRVTGFAPSGYRNLRTRGQRRTLSLGEAVHHVEYVIDGDRADVLVGAWPEPDTSGAIGPDTRRRCAVRLLSRADDREVVEVDGRRSVVAVDRCGESIVTRSAAGTLTWVRPQRWVDHDTDEAGSGPVCPLPGTVIAVHVEAGQVVTDGQLLMVVEAMKMEHKISAHGEHVVAAVRFAVGDRVDAGDLLVELVAHDPGGVAP